MDTYTRRVARSAPGALFLLLSFEWSACAPAKRAVGGRGGAGGAAAGGTGGGGAGGMTGGGFGGGFGGGSGGSPAGGTGGGSAGSGGSGGGTGGATGGTGGSGGSGGAAQGMDAGTADLARDTGATEAAAGDVAAVPAGDAPPRPDGMGQACAVGQNYGFTIRQFPSQTGTFTAYFTARPSNAPTNSVIGLSDGQKYIHDSFAAIVRFGTSGNLDARNGAAYTSLTPIRYMVTDYNFRLVVNVAAKTYSAYVSWGGMPEVTIGTNLAFRDSAGTVNKLDWWGVEAINPHMTRVCGFQVQ